MSIHERRLPAPYQADNEPGSDVLQQRIAVIQRIQDGGYAANINERPWVLIKAYIGTDATYASLCPLAEVTSRARVQQLVKEGLRRLDPFLPTQLAQALEMALQAKSREARARISEAQKGKKRRENAEQPSLSQHDVIFDPPQP